MSLRLPRITVGLRQSTVVTRATLFRSVGLPPAQSPHSTDAECFIMPGLPDRFVLNFRFRAKPGLSSGEAVIINRRLLPGLPG